MCIYICICYIYIYIYNIYIYMRSSFTTTCYSRACTTSPSISKRTR